MAPKKVKQESQQRLQPQGKQQEPSQKQKQHQKKKMQPSQQTTETAPKTPNQTPKQDKKNQQTRKATETKQQAQRKHNPPSWSMKPSEHTNVSHLLETTSLTFTFHPDDCDTTSLKEHDTTILCHFHCFNPSCASKGWVSGHVATTIRLYVDSQYNARIYHQRCKECHWISKPRILKDSYAERVAYRLKVWSGVPVEKMAKGRKTQIEHSVGLCEGCRAGRCKVGGRVGD